MKQLHTIQIQILKELLFKPIARFADLNTTELTNDHFTFHLKQLVNQGLVSKSEKGYELTSEGMELAGRVDIDQIEIVSQPKIGIAACVLKIEGGKQFVLLNKRLKNQALGLVGLHTEKVKLGEKLTDTLERCIAKEVGDISYGFKFSGISHVIDYEDGELSLDVILHCFRVDIKDGKVFDSTKEGENMWVEISEINSVPNLMPGIYEVVQRIVSNETFFLE